MTVLVAVAAVLTAVELLVPGFTARGAPAVLAAVTLALAALLRWHVTGQPGDTGWTWRGMALIAVFLGAGQAVRAVQGVGVNPPVAGPADAFLAVTGPVAALICLRMVRSSGGRFRARVALDTGVALLAVCVLVEVLLPATAGRVAPGALLLTLGYPAVSAVLCAAGLVTVATVTPPRRTAAGWLLLGFAFLAVAMAAQAQAVVAPAPPLDVVMSVAYLGMLAAATRALATDPGPGPAAATVSESVAAPLTAVVVSYCLAFGVVLFLISGWTAGRTVHPLEAAATGVLLVLTFARSLVWATDGARLYRQVLRTEAYFRTLVHGAADLTLVLDGQGRITWASSAGRGPGAWAARDLEGRPLSDFVHADDVDELRRALDPRPTPEAGAPVFRLLSRDGGWRRFETVRTTGPGSGQSAQARGRRVLHLRDVVERDSEAAELERLAYTDYLTGLPNRASLMSALAAARRRAASGEPACLLMLDLDGFKPVNDIAGHEAGDQLLVQVAGRLRATVRDRDLVGRLGGDEFAVLVRSGLEEASALAERIVADLGALHPTAPTLTASPGAPAGNGRAELVFDISGSIGITEMDPADDVATTVRQADLALRAAKAAGKNRVVRHGDAVDSASGRRTRLARDLPAAIEEGRLRVVYQPVVGLEERRVLGVEALVRWDHPELGPVAPDEFIGLAEDDGLIVPLQREVLRIATTDMAGLLAEGRDLVVGVNISVRHLQAGCLAPDVAQALAAAGVAPRRLHLEITESVMIDREDRLESDLGTLREMGCVISLDDFGRGYSSLAYLARLPVDILKMDREFVAGIEDDARGAALVASIVELGRTLGMDVVAEGVETRAQLAALAGMGCRFVQGYLLGRPMPVDELRAALDSFRLDAVAPAVDAGVHLVGGDG